MNQLYLNLSKILTIKDNKKYNNNNQKLCLSKTHFYIRLVDTTRHFSHILVYERIRACVLNPIQTSSIDKR